MPEIGEVARVVHYLRKSLVGKTLASVKAQDDTIVFGKVGTSGAEFQKALTGKKVVGAGQQGKYFWLLMDSPPHPVMHLGMTGWIHIKGESTFYHKSPKVDEEEWPPKYWKFHVETKDKVECAFTDPRRLARIRLVDCPADEIRKNTPLKENGPDPVVDQATFTEDFFEKLMNKKKVPVKALLLNQANISGIGNWVGDEVMYHAKLHPEQYSNTFTSEQLKQLHKSIRYVCQTAVDLLSDSSKFPDDWLFKHRWGKGKKDKVMALPSGEKITFLTVGGRTSCIVPSVQKKTGAVAGDVKTEKDNDLSENDDEPESKPIKKAAKGKKAVRQKDDASEPTRLGRKRKVVKSEDENEDEDENDVDEEVVEEKPKGRNRKQTATKPEKDDAVTSTKSKKVKIEQNEAEESVINAGRRRSARRGKSG